MNIRPIAPDKVAWGAASWYNGGQNKYGFAPLWSGTPLGGPTIRKELLTAMDTLYPRGQNDNTLLPSTSHHTTSLLDTIITGDCRELIERIPDESVDLIFTDPPYLKEFLPLYGWLAEEAARVLKPGGFLLTYVGSLWKYQNMLALGQHLEYFYDYVVVHSGLGSMLWNRKTVARHKSILAFVKGSGQPRCKTLSMFNGSGTDKRFHAWGQDEQTARYYIDCFSRIGDVVLEPFVGGGTTPYVCKQIERHCIGFEIDPHTAEIARQRIANIQMPLPELSATQLQFEDAEEVVA